MPEIVSVQVSMQFDFATPELCHSGPDPPSDDDLDTCNIVPIHVIVVIDEGDWTQMKVTSRHRGIGLSRDHLRGSCKSSQRGQDGEVREKKHHLADWLRDGKGCGMQE